MTLDKEKKIAYLEFPAKPEEVRKAKADGYEIIDAIFAPKKPEAPQTPDKTSAGGDSHKTGAAQ